MSTSPTSHNCVFAVMHFAPTYTPSVTPIYEDQVSTYFNEDNGFESHEIERINALVPTESFFLDNLEVIRLL